MTAAKAWAARLRKWILSTLPRCPETGTGSTRTRTTAGSRCSARRVAHGLLVLSIASGLAVRMGFMEGTVQAFMQLEWQFRRPVLIGDTVRLRATVRAKKPMRRMGGGVVTFKMEVLNQKDEVCQRGSWDILCKNRPYEVEEET